MILTTGYDCYPYLWYIYLWCLYFMSKVCISCFNFLLFTGTIQLTVAILTFIIIYIYIYTYIHTCRYIHIYIEWEREKDKDREREWKIKWLFKLGDVWPTACICPVISQFVIMYDYFICCKTWLVRPFWLFV